VNATLLAAVTSGQRKELAQLLELFTSRAATLLLDEQADDPSSSDPHTRNHDATD
jgi:hypothetical protein